MTIDGDRQVGIGTEGEVFTDFQVEINNINQDNGLLIDVEGAGALGLEIMATDPNGVGAQINATDAGVVVGNNFAPITGVEISAQAVGVLLDDGFGAPAVGVAMEDNDIGLLIENAGTASIDAEGDVFLNDNWAGDNYLNTNGSSGNTRIGGGAPGIPADTRLIVDNVIDVAGHLLTTAMVNQLIASNGNNWSCGPVLLDLVTLDTFVCNTGNTANAGSTAHVVIGTSATFDSWSTGSFGTIIGSLAGISGNKS